MTPASSGGECQIRISGGIQSPIWYTLREDAQGFGVEDVCWRRPESRAQNSQASFEFPEKEASVRGKSQEQVVRIWIIRIQAVLFQKYFLKCIILQGSFQVVHAAILKKMIV